jgi:hypothetical protein
MACVAVLHPAGKQPHSCYPVTVVELLSVQRC